MHDLSLLLLTNNIHALFHMAFHCNNYFYLLPNSQSSLTKTVALFCQIIPLMVNIYLTVEYFSIYGLHFAMSPHQPGSCFCCVKNNIMIPENIHTSSSNIMITLHPGKVHNGACNISVHA